MNEYYFEIYITPNNFVDLFVSEISDFTNEAIEIAQTADVVKSNPQYLPNDFLDSTAIVIRTENDMDFVDSLLKHLNVVCEKWSLINNTEVRFWHTISKKQNKDWIKEYKDSIKPLYCAGFYIRPPWIESDVAISDTKSNITDIILEPSLAFGSGHHATTFMCIEALQSCIEKSNSNELSLLDVGCGSGILSLCANKLGVSVSMCDVDSLAIEETKKNFLQNNATITRIWLGSIDEENIDKYDIVVANLVASVIKAQSENLIASLKKGAFLILSGILDKYKNCVLEYFYNLVLIEEKRQDEWICLVLLNK